LPKIDCILGHEASVKQHHKIEITLSIQSEWNKTRNQKQSNPNTLRLNNTLLNDHWVIEEIRVEIKKFPESN
jgi:hypothetical protein